MWFLPCVTVLNSFDTGYVCVICNMLCKNGLAVMSCVEMEYGLQWTMQVLAYAVAMLKYAKVFLMMAVAMFFLVVFVVMVFGNGLQRYGI